MDLSKIEKRALNYLESIIDSCPSIDYNFNYADKEMSWDGFIYAHKNGAARNGKTSFTGRVPVQIKGHMDANHDYINKEHILYDVNMDDLRAYSTEKGVLYFQIFISDEANAAFYASLFPSKIADILKDAE